MDGIFSSLFSMLSETILGFFAQIVAALFGGTLG